MINFSHKGDFSQSLTFMNNVKTATQLKDLDRYGQRGVTALKSATPVDTSKTANSWYYKVENTTTSIKISFHNSNIQNGVPIAIILQYGHATRNGGFINGRDYINPAIQPIFDDMLNSLWKEITNK